MLPPVTSCPSEETPWSHLIDSLTAPLSRNGITTGLLYDRALPLASLHAFGVRRADTTGSTHLRQAYLELWTAAYDRCTFRLTPDQFRERANRVVRHDSVPLAVLDYQFQVLDTLAVQDNLVSVQNGRLYDVAGRSRSPYQLRSLVLAAPLLDTLRQYTATFVLPAALLLTNRTRRVSGVTVDFNDGGPNRSLLLGQSISITYAGNGRKAVWFTVHFTDGSTAQVRSAIYVKASAVSYRSIPVTLANLGTIKAQIPFQDYNSATSLYGQGNVLAVLHNPASQAEYDNSQPIKLRRPVVIMDGFDPQDARPLFIGKKSFYNDLSNQRILELLNDQNLQRDLIILNFPVGPRQNTSGTTTQTDIDGGADYVERNAMVLVELINRLKPLLANDPATGQPYQFTIIGPSMGGLVSRYALAYMEKQAAAGATPPGTETAAYWQHNTTTWVSFDAPHQGAVVPMGDQAFLSFFQGMAESARETLVNTVNSPAAKQMLVHHILASGAAPTGAPGFRDRFMLALRDNGEANSLGYPVHLRRVAIADGRLNGQGDFGTPCGKMFDVDIRFRTGNAIGITVLSLLFSPFSQVPTRIGACTARFAPGPGTSCTVFEGVLNYSIYGYNFPGGFTYVPVRSRRVIDGGTQGSWDLAPGGSRPTQADLKQQAEAAGRTGAGREQAYKVEVSNVQNNHAFIPSVSALGFQYRSVSSYQNTGSLPNPYSNLLGRNMVCDNEIPFDDFYAPASDNLGHVTTDAGAELFLIRELTPQVATPTFTQATASACPTGGTFTFQVKQECVANRPSQQQSATTYNWTVTAGGTFAGNVQQLNGAGPTQAVTIAPAPSNSIVDLSVTAVRAGAAPSTTVTRRIHITDAYANVTAPSEIAKFYTFTAALDQENTTGPYTWSISPQFKASILNPGTANGPSIQVRANNAGQITITATGTDACTGASFTAASATVTITTGGLRPAPARAAAYPNPADAVLHLAAPDATEAAAPARTAVLYNAQGREVRRSTAPEATQLPTADLPSGLYYLLVEQQGKVSRSQIRVQH